MERTGQEIKMADAAIRLSSADDDFSTDL